eukprot:m.223800 g.223800  ORF g.223800 m.223800 type:complete len:418 (-) comp17273_c0_seq20:2311-3564(-)
MTSPSRSTLLLAGFACQLSGIVFSTLIPLFVVNVLNKTPTEFANGTFAWRYFGITVGVAIFGPLGSIIGAGRTLRLSLFVTLLVELAMGFTDYQGLRICVAVGSASTSLAMVQVNALIQTLGRKNPQFQAKVNAEYRFLAAFGAVVFPAFTTNVIIRLVPSGYWIAFFLAGSICAVGCLGLETAFDDLVKTTSAASDKANESSTQPKSTSSALSLQAWTKPYTAILTSPRALSTLFHVLLISLPSHVVGTFISSRFKDVGASQEFQGASMSLAAAVAIPAIFGARVLLRTMSPQAVYALLGGCNGVVITLVGLVTDPYLLASLNMVSFMMSKAGPIAHSVWSSQSVEPILLPAMFAVEKVMGCFFRFLISRLLGFMAERMVLGDIFVVFGLVGVAVAVMEAFWLQAAAPSTSKLKGE